MSDLVNLSIAEAGAKVRAKETSFPELVRACLERERQTHALNGWIEIYEYQAIKLAEAQQTLLENGYDLGPLQGIPLGLKANIDIAGQEMNAGSEILRGNMAAQDAAVTRALKQAGAIILGTTNMHEFAWGGTTNNPHYGACHNPWDTARVPAGSSGGSGVVAAVRSAFATLGTDTGGSVRLPAALNGVTGLRPTVGNISTEGVFPLAWSMDTVGPLAARSADCALLYGTLSGMDAAQQSAMSRQMVKPLQGLRIGVLDPYSFYSLQPGVEQAFRAALNDFEAQGVDIISLRVDGLEHAVDAQIIVDACEPSAIHWPWLKDRPEKYGDDVRILLQAGLTFTAVEYLQAQRYRTWLREKFAALFEEVDMIITPTLPFTAPLIGQETIPIGDGEVSTLLGNLIFTCLPSLAVLPAISFPAGFDSQNLPVGLQLMAAPGQERLLLRAAHQYQLCSDYHLRQPPLFRL